MLHCPPVILRTRGGQQILSQESFKHVSDETELTQEHNEPAEHARTVHPNWDLPS